MPCAAQQHQIEYTGDRRVAVRFTLVKCIFQNDLNHGEVGWIVDEPSICTGEVLDIVDLNDHGGLGIRQNERGSVKLHGNGFLCRDRSGGSYGERDRGHYKEKRKQQ